MAGRGVVAAVAAGTVVYQLVDSRSFFHRKIIPSLALRLDPENAHRLAVFALANGLGPRDCTAHESALETTVWGIPFPNPLGMAAGFDKHAEAINGLFRCGFGFVEVGSVTPLPQPGNDRPRVFRLPQDSAVINRYGFNSEGIEAVRRRLSQRTPGGVVGVNLGKNKLQTDDTADYVAGVAALGPYASYLVVNVSSPNTPGLRDLQHGQRLTQLLHSVVSARDALPTHKPPVLVKISPDVTQPQLQDIADAVVAAKVDGVIVSNTTLSRPRTLTDDHREETGGLSGGSHVFQLSTQVLRDMYRLTDGRVPLIGVGGVSSAQDAYQKIRNGASLVQLYTAMAYQGPAIAADIKTELAALLRSDGFTSVAQAVGVDVPRESKDAEPSNPQ